MKPKIITLKADVWELVAAGVTVGRVKKVRHGRYIETYRDANDTPPRSEKEGVILFKNDNYADINSSSPIDVYVMSIGETGQIRLDL
jgi:hypothetical protein